jgi:hypothetical protein
MKAKLFYYELYIIVSVDLYNRSHLIQLGNLILKKEAKNLHRYATGMLYYWAKQKLI